MNVLEIAREVFRWAKFYADSLLIQTILFLYIHWSGDLNLNQFVRRFIDRVCSSVAADNFSLRGILRRSETST
ncbi:hypothetical protein [Paraburkholderia hospita]|uniref:hypothetical protein n=1 Tax=Paraburkholderia hospita TaxID=169430 RepID=UPI000B343DD9|nr:hypothetical protein [Paraburkholderia hospita]OUL75732.1 hypothetical protein CA601_41635 [Paraburkholderia hospita]